MSSGLSPVRRPAKRLRTARACDACRKRKSKCDGGQPTCAICVSAGRRCSYNNTTSKRGLQPGYVRALEGLLGLMIDMVPQSESTIRSALQKSTGKSGFPRGALAEKGVDAWRSSQLAAHVDRLLQRLDCSDDEDDGPSSAEENHGALDLDTTTSKRVSMDKRIDTSQVLIPPTLPHTQSLTSTGLFPSSPFSDGPFPPNAMRLVDLYFTHTHCWLPIIERRDILRIVHRARADTTRDRASIRPNERALVWVICAYSRYSTPSPWEIDVGVDATSIHKYIQSCVGMNGNEAPSLPGIQALLILVLLHLGLGNVHDAWIMVGQAARMLLLLDRAREPRPGRFQHVFHACVLLDHVTSAVMRRPPCVTLTDQDQPDEIDEDGLDEWETWRGIDGGGNSAMGASPSSTPLRSLSNLNLASRLADGWEPRDRGSSERCAEDRVLHLLNWHAKLPRDYRLSESVPFSPPIHTLHLIWGLFVGSSLSRYTTTTQPSPLRIAESTLDMANTYIRKTGSVGSSPLLGLCVQQMLACLATVPLAHVTPAMVDTREKLEELQRIIRMHWTSIHTTRDPSRTSFRAEAEAENSAPDILQPTTQSRQDCVCNESLDPERLVETQGVVGPETDKTGDSNEFDSLFEEMAASMPAIRSTTEPLFAHNLGFITQEWDSDFLSFLRQPLDP